MQEAVHALAPAKEYVPGRHWEQLLFDVDPFKGLLVPAGHKEHAVSLGLLSHVPDGQD